MSRKATALLEKTALGETSVSLEVLGQIAENAVKSNSEVYSCKTKVYTVGNTVRIDVRAVTAAAVSLVEITHVLEDAAKEAILAQCGIPIGIVDITVDQTDAPSKKA